MTTFFNRLLGRSQKTTAAVTPEPVANAKQPTTGSAGYTFPPDIRQFLERDFYKTGFEGAMQFPLAENRTCLIKAITSEFRLILQDVGQRIDAQVVQQQQLKMQTRGISKILEEQIESRLEQLKGLKQTVEGQILLSIDHDGWIAPALARFEHGFLNGILKHQSQNGLLEGINTLLVKKETANGLQPNFNNPLNPENYDTDL